MARRPPQRRAEPGIIKVYARTTSGHGACRSANEKEKTGKPRALRFAAEKGGGSVSRKLCTEASSPRSLGIRIRS